MTLLRLRKSLVSKKRILFLEVDGILMCASKQRGFFLEVEQLSNLYMKKDSSALSFSEKERICESGFFANGPYWHIYTDGTRMQNIFCCEEDYATEMHL